MSDYFKDFLKSSVKFDNAVMTIPAKNKEIAKPDRIEILQEKVSLFCKKFGDVGADALDEFIIESVKSFSGFNKPAVREQRVDETKQFTNPFDHANAILSGEQKPYVPQPAPAGSNDIMSRAMSLLGG